jgi:mevalonate kinase
LFGEHAVVHGQPALAAALEAGMRLRSASPGDALRVHIQGWDHQPTAARDGSRLGQALGRILDTLQRDRGPVPPHTLTFSCDLPAGAGLGSSAAWAVAVAQACCLLQRPQQPAPLDLILEAADASERVFHGNPSGVDHTTSALGGTLWFERGQPPVLRPLKVDPLPLIIAQVQPGADTGQMVAGVQDLLDQAPRAARPLLESLGQLTHLAAQALAQSDLPSLGRWMDVAHGALAALGVSTPELDAACHLARAHGAWGAKLTGAGGGGCMIAVAPAERHQDIAQALRAQGSLTLLLTRAGFHRQDLA